MSQPLIELRITERTHLAELWLPWCVERADPNRVMKVNGEPHLRPLAKQLRVGDVSAHRVALADNDGINTTARIESLARMFTALAQRGRIVLAAVESLHHDHWPQAFPLGDGPMLHEACHRSCALYVADVSFELRVLVHAVFGPWTLYEDPALRS